MCQVWWHSVLSSFSSARKTAVKSARKVGSLRGFELNREFIAEKNGLECQIVLRFALLLQKTAVRLLHLPRSSDSSKLKKKAFFDVLSLCTVRKIFYPIKNVCHNEGEIENGRGNNFEKKLNELNEYQVNSKKKEGTV